MLKIKKALLSVSDKTGIIELAKVLKEFETEIISTGGTKKVLEEAGIEVTDIQEVTGNPEAFGGRMKTISFNIESALLFDRENDSEEAKQLNIEPIDLVICNLYPFAKVKEQNANLETLIENIDIGGPTMVRAAAKNFKYIATIVDVNDYAKIIDELKAQNGSLSYDTRFTLMRKAFNHTADYDALIATTMDRQAGERSLRLAFIEGKKLRYGENSHQKGFFYKEVGAENSLADMKILHGKELSYNNLSDIQSAVDSVKDLQKFGCAIIKHNNPCGLAEGENQRQVFEDAWNGDPISAFGSIIAFNKPLDLKTVEFLNLNNENKRLRKFVEVVIAPQYSDDALQYLQFHKNLRVIEFNPQHSKQKFEIKYLSGSLLLQDCDDKLYDKLENVTEKQIDTISKKGLIEFGIKAMRQVKSNSIIIVRKVENGNFQLLGMGAGQPNRLVSTKLAIEKARENLRNEFNSRSAGQQVSESASQEGFEEYFEQELGKAILVSDAFFPFADNVELAAKAGIRKIIQPGGSIRDKAVIRKCNDLGVAMVFTGIRHFKH
ncbi:MAG TPA: bifunctional phosphoribosylaminoimidazolecarboxamide formyltransferase/IMP cyclohydrolase [Candidatus Cloacimonetes bacterium]|nr:bifunctional phosphoribosylaminoimidazolecarboxamide formyltransferase/IMP cyclohydrolase [Candidatus Cloacimonadota bacterium]